MSQPYRENPAEATVREIVAWIRERAENTAHYWDVGTSERPNVTAARVGRLMADEIERRWVGRHG